MLRLRMGESSISPQIHILITNVLVYNCVFIIIWSYRGGSGRLAKFLQESILIAFDFMESISLR